MIFVDGVYHADPHPGNMLARADGALVLLDFGAVAELSPAMREGIPEFLEGVIRRDTDRLIKALRKMGFLARARRRRVSEKVIEYFHQRFQEEVKLESFNLKDIKIDPQRGFENLLDLRKMNIGLQELSGAFHVPRDWVLLERTLLLLTGVCTQLDPELNPMEVIRPYLQDFVLGNRDWAQDRARGGQGHGAASRHAARRSAQVPHARDARRARGQSQRPARRRAPPLRRRAPSHLRRRRHVRIDRRPDPAPSPRRSPRPVLPLRRRRLRRPLPTERTLHQDTLALIFSEDLDCGALPRGPVKPPRRQAAKDFVQALRLLVSADRLGYGGRCATEQNLGGLAAWR